MKKLIFGAGHYARLLIADNMLRKNTEYAATIVSQTENNPSIVGNLPVISIDDAIKQYGRENEIVIGVSERYKEEIVDALGRKGFRYISNQNVASIDFKNYHNITKEDYLRAWFFGETGKIIDWNNLKTFNEKLQWLKINDRFEEKKELVDKYMVRYFVKEKIGEQYLVPLLGAWDKYEDVDFDKLPDSFVLKCNHGSGWNAVIKNKNTVDLEELRTNFVSWLNTDYSDGPGLEIQYKGIHPRIVAEEMLVDSAGETPDYKFFVFNGVVRYIQVDIDRSTSHKRNIYTPEWEYLPVSICYPTAPGIKLEKPNKLAEMIKIAEMLGKGFRHVRVDMYYVKDKIYFGELTFSHGNGIEQFVPESFGEEMGKWINVC